MNREAHEHPSPGPLVNIDALIGMTAPALRATTASEYSAEEEQEELSELTQLAGVYHLDDSDRDEATAIPPLELDTRPTTRADHDGWPKIAVALAIGAILAVGGAFTVHATTSRTSNNQLVIAASPAAVTTRFVPTAMVPEIIVFVTAPPTAKPAKAVAAIPARAATAAVGSTIAASPSASGPPSVSADDAPPERR